MKLHLYSEITTKYRGTWIKARPIGNTADILLSIDGVLNSDDEYPDYSFNYLNHAIPVSAKIIENKKGVVHSVGELNLAEWHLDLNVPTAGYINYKGVAHYISRSSTRQWKRAWFRDTYDIVPNSMEDRINPMQDWYDINRKGTVLWRIFNREYPTPIDAYTTILADAASSVAISDKYAIGIVEAVNNPVLFYKAAIVGIVLLRDNIVTVLLSESAGYLYEELSTIDGVATKYIKE